MLHPRPAVPIVGIFAGLIFALSCQRDDPATPLSPAPADRVDSDGDVYVAQLTALNAGVKSDQAVTGRATVVVEGGQITVTVEARGLTPSIQHMQHIHGQADGSASSCPTPQRDVNGDGVVDVGEGVPDYGPVIVPLDADLTTSAAVGYPFADADGRYSYASPSASVAAVTAAAQQLVPVGALDLARRAIVIHGVDPAVSGLDPGLAVGLPVACGTLELVK